MTTPMRPDKDWILTVLFHAAMSDDPARYAQKEGFDAAFLPMWREQYHREYIHYLESLLREIKARVDDWPIP